MNSSLNLFKDKKLSLKLKPEEIDQGMVLNQTKKCEEKFDKWQKCIKQKSWNDVQCVGQLKPRYEYCIQKRNLMQTILEDRFGDEL
jgi:hypothetical protein